MADGSHRASTCRTGIRDVDSAVLDAGEALAFIGDDAHGAQAIFVGVVRDHNHGRQVKAVSYDVFEPLAVSCLNAIAAEVQAEWGEGLRIYAVHARGRIPVGGASVVIAVSSPHREAAFAACRYVIEQIKERAPIWKQEHYLDGDSEWVQGHALCGGDH